VSSSASEDRQLVAAFLEMMAAEAGAARNTLLAYERDLRGASELLGGNLSGASEDELGRLGEAWRELKRASVARKAAALRRFFAFLQDEGLRADDPSPALPRPATERTLPKVLDTRAVDLLFAEVERRSAEEGGPAALRMAALLELLYGSGGAIALAAANRVLMLEHSVYAVISPEGCASILWRTAEKAAEAAEAMRVTAGDLKALGVVDRIVAEPVGGAHRDPNQAVATLGDAIGQELQTLSAKPPEQLRAERRAKFLAIG
jgi:site-specific recombinase XerD